MTLWELATDQIEDDFYTNNSRPFVVVSRLVVTSTIVNIFRGNIFLKTYLFIQIINIFLLLNTVEHYLSFTSATKVYINLEKPETATSIER